MEQTLDYSATGIPNGRLGIWTFLASEVMLFGAFISSYIVLRIGSPNFGAPDAAIMGVPLASFNTFCFAAPAAPQWRSRSKAFARTT